MCTFESKSSDKGRAGRNLARGLPRRRQLGRRAPPPLLGGARPHERDALTAAGRVLAGGALTCKPSALTRAACVQIGGCARARAGARSQQRRTWVPGTAASSPRARGGRCGTLREARPEAHRRRRGPPAPPRRRRGRAAAAPRRRACARPEGKIHRVDPDFGSTLTVSNRDFQSNCSPGQLANYGSTL